MGVELRIAVLRGLLLLVAASELGWSLLFYFRPDLALGALGRTVVDPVIARQYPLYLASAGLAYALAAADPSRYRGIVWVCVTQRIAEFVAAVVDRHALAISNATLAGLGAIEAGLAVALVLASRLGSTKDLRTEVADPRDRGLTRLLRGFGGLEVFWFLASTIFVQLGSRLLHWKLQDPYTTQQQGIALLAIGLTSLVCASDVSRYRVLVWVPIASQLIGIANSFNEIHLGSIGWGVAAVQWTIESTIVFAFVYFSRHHVRAWRRIQAFAK